MVLLEVQMHPDPNVHGRLSAQSLRFVERHPKLEHLEQVHWVSLEELSQQPDLDPQYSEDQLMQIAEIPREEMRHTRLVQDWLAEGRQEGRQDEAASMTLRQLTRRCGPLSEATTAQIQALPLQQLEALADALLDFQGPADLAAWLAARPTLSE